MMNSLMTKYLFTLTQREGENPKVKYGQIEIHMFNLCFTSVLVSILLWLW